MDMIRDDKWPDEDDRDVEAENEEDADYYIDDEDDDLDLGECKRKQMKAQRAAHREYRGARTRKASRHSNAA